MSEDRIKEVEARLETFFKNNLKNGGALSSSFLDRAPEDVRWLLDTLKAELKEHAEDEETYSKTIKKVWELEEENAKLRDSIEFHAIKEAARQVSKLEQENSRLIDELNIEQAKFNNRGVALEKYKNEAAWLQMKLHFAVGMLSGQEGFKQLTNQDILEIIENEALEGGGER